MGFRVFIGYVVFGFFYIENSEFEIIGGKFYFRVGGRVIRISLFFFFF